MRDQDTVGADSQDAVNRWKWEKLVARLPKAMLTATDRLVAFRLASYSNVDDGSAIWPSQARVADDCALGERSVWGSWHRLREVGLLAEEKDGDRLAWTAQLFRIAEAEDERRRTAADDARAATAERVRRHRARRRNGTSVRYTDGDPAEDAPRNGTSDRYVTASDDDVTAPGAGLPNQDQTNRPDQEPSAKAPPSSSPLRASLGSASRDKITSSDERDRELAHRMRALIDVGNVTRAVDLAEAYFDGLSLAERNAAEMLNRDSAPDPIVYVHTIQAMRDVGLRPEDDPSLAVECPRCGRPPGRPCLGYSRAGAHLERKQAADPGYDPAAGQRRRRAS